MNEEIQPICCFCECDSRFHCYFLKCPHFDNELICCDCCQVDMLEDGVEKKINAITEKTLTRKEIDIVCRDCGKRNVND